MLLWHFFLALISVIASRYNCNKNNVLTSISDPEEIRKAKKQIYYFFLRYKFCFKKGYWLIENISFSYGDCFQILPHRKSYFKYSTEYAVRKGKREGHGKLQELAASSEGNFMWQVLPLDVMQHLLEKALLKCICSRPCIILPLQLPFCQLFNSSSFMLPFSLA